MYLFREDSEICWKLPTADVAAMQIEKKIIRLY